MTLPVERTMLLAIGFGCLTGALYLAWNSPATGYEVSIFRGTPAGFWIGVAGAFLAAAVVSVADARDRLAGMALVLGGMSATAIGGLPVIRGYRLYGLSDSMTHLGWSEEIRAGDLGFFDMFYPASHHITVLAAELTSITTERATIVFMMLMVGLYILFVPLCAHAITNDPRVTVIAAFSGFMLLPFTTLSTALHFHTYSIGTMFLPLVLYTLIRYLTAGRPIGTLRRSFNGWMVALIVVGAAMLFIHPQVKLNLVLLLGAIVVLQFRYRKRPDHPLGTLQPTILVFAVLAVMWIVWMVNFSHYLSVGDRVFQAVIGVLSGTSEPGETVTSQVTSAQLIGAGAEELFLKIFLIPLVYCLFAVYAGTRVILGGFKRTTHHTGPMVAYFAWSGVVLLPFFAMHYAGDMSHLFFRHVGFALVLATIFGAIGLAMLATDLFGSLPTGGIKVVGVVVLAIALVLALLVAFPSPYIYSQSHHATDQDMTGHAAAFDHGDATIGFSGVRNWPHRYADALTTDFPYPTYPGLTGEELAAPTTVRDGPYYLPVSQVDHDREVIAYHELRYTNRDFVRLEATEQVDKLYTNGEYTLYLVNPRVEDAQSVSSWSSR